jgi:hypothetical protein
MGGMLRDKTRDVPVTRSELAAGFFYRRQFSEKRSFVVGVEFQDNQFRIPTDSQSKLRTKTAGVRASLTGQWDDWGLGLMISPKHIHEEYSDAGTRSGSSIDNYKVGLKMFRRWVFNSNNAMQIIFRHDVEQMAFGGLASSPDLVSGTTPSGVGVTVGTTVIQFGFDWSQ